jgi:hypothetical protein
MRSSILPVQSSSSFHIHHRLGLVTVEMVPSCSILSILDLLVFLLSNGSSLCIFIDNLLALCDQVVNTVLINVLLVGSWEIQSCANLFVPQSVLSDIILLACNDGFQHLILNF